ncbi:glutathione S-transferase family protein [Marinicella sp. W31]|uniref:glutathione S-transferase family protein n=1 Tax=Marinicella sp. W31 TaxID=3023713 RepID=UPI0037567F99
MSYTLVIGNKNYSSWSLRPWLLMKHLQLNFTEVKVPLYQADTKQQLLQHSPVGQVPVLKTQDTAIWDSLAICEYLTEQHGNGWPEDSTQRALARAISCEMHSGFSQIRSLLPMNCRLRIAVTLESEPLKLEIERVLSIWKTQRQQHGDAGDFLFGGFSVADCMYAPVVLRFESYGIPVEQIHRDYMDAILALPAMQVWIAEGIQENEVISASEIYADTEEVII